MEWLLYYGYLDFKKKNFDGMPKKLLKLPLLARLLTGLLFVSGATGIAMLFISNISFYAWIPIAIEFFCCLVFYFYSEYYQRRMSSQKLEDFQVYCGKILEYLKSNSVTTIERIQEIKKRLIKHVETIEAGRKSRNEKIDRWMQVLIIPLSLAILSALVSKQNNLEIMLNHALSIIYFVVVIYVVIWSVKNTVYFFTNIKLENIKYFIDDLQGVLDTQNL